MTKNKLIFALKEGIPVSEVLPAMPFATAPTVKRMYDTDEHISNFKNKFTKTAMPYASDEHLFSTEIYPAMAEAEKKLFRTYVVELGSEEEANQLRDYLQQHGAVDYVQKDDMNILYHHPNDPLLSAQWAVPKIGCEPAWDISQGDNIVVAIVDTGVDYNHPDIAANMWKDSNGKVGYDFSNGTDDPKDYYGHGSHCAGTVAASTDNSAGVAGIAPKAKIMAVKVFPNATDEVCAKGIRYAADNGARVISNSWGPSARKPSNRAVEDAIDYACSKGCIVVFAAGNSNDDVQYYSPANYAKVISVAATDKNDTRASFSNYGSVTVAAPGVDILSLKFNSTEYIYMSGTSMACPHVSALAALILMKNNQYTFDKVKHFIQSFATSIATDKPVGKRIDALKSVLHA